MQTDVCMCVYIYTHYLGFRVQGQGDVVSRLIRGWLGLLHGLYGLLTYFPPSMGKTNIIAALYRLLFPSSPYSGHPEIQSIKNTVAFAVSRE